MTEAAVRRVSSGVTQPRRLPLESEVDQSRLLHFTFDGKRLTGHPGDTLASALLANGTGAGWTQLQISSSQRYFLSGIGRAECTGAVTRR